jgi:peptide/nickel transport system substrate-binding protein
MEETTMIDERTLREWTCQVVHGKMDRREFIRTMIGLGLTGPLLGSMLVASTPAQAQMQKADDDLMPSQRGGGGKLRLLWWQAPTILNAHLASGTKDYDASRVVYEPLAAFDPDANFVPILAAEIPSRENGGLSADGQSVTWRLKQGVRWHDGKPFTADDVVFTWEYAADEATGATTHGTYKNIERVEKIDTHTVKVVFPEPTPYWYDAFFGFRGYILPKHLFASYKGQDSRNAPYNLKPVGTGPYKIVEFKPGDAVQYEINMDYHVPNRPFFDSVELKGGGDATSAARAVLQTGEFDYAWNMQVEQNVLTRLEQGGKGRVLIWPASNIEHIQINQTDPWTEVDGERSSLKQPHPFQTDALIRQAYAKAVDRRTVAEQLYGQSGQPSSNFLVSPPRFASSNTTWEFDLEKAAALLDQSGWKRGSDGIRVKDGKRMKIVYQTSVNPLRQKTQAIVKKAFEQIGIEVELKAVQAGVYFSSDPGNPDTYSHFYTDIQMYTTGPGGPDPQAHMERFTSWQIAQKANNWSGRNPTRWSHAEYDALWKQAVTELDEVKRAALYIKMNDMVIEHNVVVPVVWRNNQSVAAHGLKGMQLTGWDSTLWRLAYWYKQA